MCFGLWCGGPASPETTELQTEETGSSGRSTGSYVPASMGPFPVLGAASQVKATVADVVCT